MYKPLKIMLLLYLSLAIFFPSYQGFENGQEFHFFKLFESFEELGHQSQLEIEAPYNHDHSHALLYFCPSQRLKRDYQIKKGGGHVFFIKDSTYLLLTTESLHDSTFPSISYAKYIYGHKSSGLSPPVAS
jgi:hypothetical protein